MLKEQLAKFRQWKIDNPEVVGALDVLTVAAVFYGMYLLLKFFGAI